MNELILCCLAAVLMGCAAIYLASPRQCWLDTPWPARRARRGGIATLLLGGLGLGLGMQLLTATFVFVTASMLAFCVLPYLGALRVIRRGGVR